MTGALGATTCNYCLLSWRMSHAYRQQVDCLNLHSENHYADSPSNSVLCHANTCSRQLESFFYPHPPPFSRPSRCKHSACASFSHEITFNYDARYTSLSYSLRLHLDSAGFSTRCLAVFCRKSLPLRVWISGELGIPSHVVTLSLYISQL